MEVQSVSRWDATPIKSKNKFKVAIAISVCAIAFLIATNAYLISTLNYDKQTNNTLDFANSSEDERSSLSRSVPESDAKLVENVAQLVIRVKALESDNQRLSAELNNLVDHDGVIERLVTHIRALHAQSEATRRDVVDAMVGPLPGSDPAFDMPGSDPALPVEATDPPFLSKAKHTIVTPVAAKVEVQKEAVPKPRGKAKPVVLEADEGATN
ncbi:hypothetical protein [Aureimonas pseudogalii]|uniref:Uncharacterized protein n=1 Tax=Aureimonas pseudogalii TaxID=1744844 RepID=A0A7W6H800_9HYPH|nr:hypothetical protein [Aureimonas pseudogalii]MBB4000103.1 hypothetical protein [Aureimonas pseudogalii]